MLLRDPWVALSAQQKQADAQKDAMNPQENRTRAAMFQQQTRPLQLRVGREGDRSLEQAPTHWAAISA